MPYDELVSGQTIYTYVNGNPLSGIDPDGLQIIIPRGGVAPPVGGSSSSGSRSSGSTTGNDVLDAGLPSQGSGTSVPMLPEWLRNILADPVLASNLRPGYWPGDKGAEEWGRRHGVDPADARGRFHGIKQKDKGRGKSVYGVNPSDGSVCNPEGEDVGNLEGAPRK